MCVFFLECIKGKWTTFLCRIPRHLLYIPMPCAATIHARVFYSAVDIWTLVIQTLLYVKGSSISFNKLASEPAYEPTNWSANKLANLFHLSKDPRKFGIFSFIRTIKDWIIKPPQQKWSHFNKKCKIEMIYCKSMQTKHSYKMALRQSAIVYKW